MDEAKYVKPVEVNVGSYTAKYRQRLIHNYRILGYFDVVIMFD